MKKLLLGMILVIISLSSLGCQQSANFREGDMEGFSEPESNDWVNYIKPIREYMYYRTQAVLNSDIDILWKKYPDLKDNIDQNQGINVEKYEVETLNQDFTLVDANFNIESYERIKVKTVNENHVVVLVHGSIVYLRDDFDESGGEYLIKIFLKQEDKHWTIVKTDEYTLPEYKEWVKDN